MQTLTSTLFNAKTYFNVVKIIKKYLHIPDSLSGNELENRVEKDLARRFY